MISLWQREQRVVDLWLMLVMWIWLFDIALAAVIGSTRFDLGFYAGRLFGLLAASFLLLTLLVETFQMYAGAIRAAASAEQNLAQLSHSSDRAGSSPLPRESIDMFIRRRIFCIIGPCLSLVRSTRLSAARSSDCCPKRKENSNLGDRVLAEHGAAVHARQVGPDILGQALASD